MFVGPKATSSLDRRGEQLVVRILKNDADAAEDLPILHLLYRFAVEEHPAKGRPQQAVEMLNQGRLAAAVRTENGEKLTAGDLQIDAVERRRAVFVGVVEVFDLEHNFLVGAGLVPALGAPTRGAPTVMQTILPATPVRLPAPPSRAAAAGRG